MENSWEELVSAGLTAKERADNLTWVIGDLALQVVATYGTDALDSFATEINVAKSTVKRYRSVSGKWKPAERFEILSHRHHMLVSNRQDRVELLTRAADEGWSVEHLRLHLKKETENIPEKVKVGSILFRRDEWERILKWFALLIDDPTALAKTDKYDALIVEKINKKVDKLIDMEKADYEVIK